MTWRLRLHPGKLAKRRIAAHLYVGSLPRATCVRTIYTAREPFSTPSIRPLSLRTRDAPRSPQHARYISTSSTSFSSFTDFFSFNKSNSKGKGKSTTLDIRNAKPEFLLSAEKGDLERMVEAYEMIIKAVEAVSLARQTDPSTSKTGRLFLSSEELAQGMRALALARYPLSWMNRLEGMYSDTRRIFGYEWEPAHRVALVLGLARSGRSNEAWEMLWNERMLETKELDGEDRLECLKAMLEYGSMSGSSLSQDWEEVFWSHRQRDERLATEERRLFLRAARRDYDPNRSKVYTTRIGEQARQGGRQLDIAGEMEYAQCLIRQGAFDQVESYIRQWEQRGLSNETDVGAGVYGVRVALAIARGESNVVEKLCLEMKERDMEVPYRAMSYLFQREYERVNSIEGAVVKVEERILAPFDSKGWASIFRYLRRRRESEGGTSVKGSEEIVSTYLLARSRGLEVDTIVAEAVFSSLVYYGKTDRIRHMSDVLDDVLRYDVDLKETGHALRLRRLFRSTFMDCAKPSPPSTTTALQLLEKATEHGVPIPDVDQVLFTLIRNAGDHEMGYKIYEQYRATNVIDAEAYNKIFNAYITLSPTNGIIPLPPVELALEMVKHMQQAGAAPGQHVITSLLSRYSALASARRQIPAPIMEERITILREAVKNLHTRIKLDPGIEMDVPLLTALMDAFNRVECRDESLKIWNELVDRRSRLPEEFTRKHYPAVVSVALDVCAYGDMSTRADKIWLWARRHRFAEGVKEWNDWIECLCRLKKWEEAVEVACGQMNGKEEGVPQANEETVRILAKFSWRVASTRTTGLKKIKDAFPEYWEKVGRPIVEQPYRPREIRLNADS